MVNNNEVHVKYQKRKNQKYSLLLMSELRPLNGSVYFSIPYFNYKDLEPEREEGWRHLSVFEECWGWSGGIMVVVGGISSPTRTDRKTVKKYFKSLLKES